MNMKKLIIAALLVVSVSTFAQDGAGKSNRGANNGKSAEERTEAQLKKMTSDLSLDENQQAQMKSIMVEQNAKNAAMREERMAKGDAKTSKEDREAMKTKRDADKLAMDNRIKAVLNAKQFEKYKAMEEANKAKMAERGNGERAKRGGNNNDAGE